MSRYERFDRSRVRLQPISQRGHDCVVSDCRELEPVSDALGSDELDALVRRILDARRNDRPVIFMMGAHLIKLGLSRFLIDLIRRRIVTHVAMNGAGIIHDFELALVGGTSEDVAKWIKHGQFGLWQETSRLNDIIAEAAERDEGLGEAVGRVIEDESFTHCELSILAAGYRSGIPITVHVSIGSDIIHSHANCDGAATGKTTYADFLTFAGSVQNLDGGVFLNIGSAVTGPEVFLKALSMARNVARQDNSEIRNFSIGVFDLVQLPENYRDGPPTKAEPLYYYRPWKTLLCRTVVDGGESHFVHGDFRQTIPALWWELVKEDWH